MIIKNLNLPVVILHEMEGVKYKITGHIQSLNEEAETCQVKFKNGRVEDIPVESIYLTEGILSKIKDATKKAISWVVEKVKGFIAFIGPDGKENFNNMPNKLIMQSKGEQPKCAKLYPSKNIVEECREFGIDVTVPDDEEMCENEINDEIKGINSFWERVMKRTATTPETIGESIDYVRETFYKGVFDKSDHINEAGIADLKNIPDAFGRRQQYGAEVDREGLIQAIKQNVANQLRTYESAIANSVLGDIKEDDYADENQLLQNSDNGDVDDWSDITWEEEDEDGNTVTVSAADTYKTMTSNADLDARAARGEFVKPLMIWGAPGIGKTQIVKQALLEMKRDTKGAQNFNVYTFACQNINEDSVAIPAPGETKEISIPGKDGTTGKENSTTVSRPKRAYFNLASMQFLPIYTPGSKEDNEVNEDHLNHSMHLTSDGTAMIDKDGDTYNCGVIFLDEIVRARMTGMTALMGLCRREYQTMKLASNWAIICAANRESDSPEQEGHNMMYDSAFTDTFVHVTFVPKKSDWVDWAESHNNSGFMSKIDSKILDFIRKSPEKYWYRTIANGGFNTDLRYAKDNNLGDIPGKQAELEKYLTDIELNPDDHINPEFYNKIVKEITSIENGGFLSTTVVGWTPRTIQMMSDAYRNALRELFMYDYKDKDGKVQPGTLTTEGVNTSNYSSLYDYNNLVLRSMIGDLPKRDPNNPEAMEKAKQLLKTANDMQHGRNYKYNSTAISDQIFAKAVEKLKPGEFTKWLNKHFGKQDAPKIKKALSNGSMTYTDLQNRLLLKTARLYTNNADGGISANEVTGKDNEFVKELGNDLKWRSDLNQNVIEEIYTQGRLPSNMIGKDCMNMLAWKKDAQLYSEVVKFVLDSFPTNNGDSPADQLGFCIDGAEFICERISYFLEQIGSAKNGKEAVKEAMKMTINSSGKPLPAANPEDTDGMNPYVTKIEKPTSEDLNKLKDLFTFKLYGVVNNKLTIIWNYKILDIPALSAENPYLLMIINHLVKTEPFYSKILNYLKWIGSTDITGGGLTRMTQTWANSRTSFLKYIENNMQGASTYTNQENDLFNAIADIKKTMNIASGDKKTYVDYLDVFMTCFDFCNQVFMSYNADAQEIQSKYKINYTVAAEKEEMGEKEKAARKKAGQI